MIRRTEIKIKVRKYSILMMEQTRENNKKKCLGQMFECTQ